MSRGSILGLGVTALLAGCVAPPEWQTDLEVALRPELRGGRDLVVFFALPGREMSDRMQARLDDPLVMAALARGDFTAVTCDGVARKRLYGAWIGGGEGMGIAVLDAAGHCYCARGLGRRTPSSWRRYWTSARASATRSPIYAASRRRRRATRCCSTSWAAST